MILTLVCIGCAIILAFLIKEPRNSELLEKSLRDSHKTHKTKSIKDKLVFICKFTIQCIKENPALSIGLICNLISEMQNI